MLIRENKELAEEKYLSPWAVKSKDSRGRLRPQAPDDLATIFEADRSRIIYSKAFRRLKHKTQVFISPGSDHMHTRLTHTLEVADIADRIASSLSLNRQLTLAIALGHDLGHAPFGHAGESALAEMYPGFAHNEQSLRVVDVLEDLNLSFEVRDGILNHRTANTPATLEGMVVNFSDKIAYINHDMDDAISSGAMNIGDFPDYIYDILGRESSQRIDTMVKDVVLTSFGKGVIQKSEEIGKATDELRAILFEKLYLGSAAKANQEDKARECLKTLFSYYLKNPDKLSGEYQIMGRADLPRAVCDYIAGMTDNFAVETYKTLFLPSKYN